VAADTAVAQTDKKKRPAQKSEKPLSCEEQKRLYRESEACFARYRRPDRTLRPEASSRCNEMVQPDC